MVIDERDILAAQALVEQIPITLPPRLGWTVEVEREISAGELQVLKLSHPGQPGYFTVEASGHRRAGGYEYLLTVFDAAGGILKGPMSFSYPAGALHFGAYYL